MLVRILLLLTLLFQQLALPGAISTAHAADCLSTGCCDLVETTTCCGEKVLEHRCGRTGGECLCGVDSDDSEPVPSAPAPENRNDLVQAFITGISAGYDLPTAIHPHMPPVFWVIHRTHNETQALLCIWRT